MGVQQVVSAYELKDIARLLGRDELEASSTNSGHDDFGQPAKTRRVQSLVLHEST